MTSKDFQLINKSENPKKLNVIFISGYRKENYWDQTEHGKQINIIQEIKNQNSIQLLEISDEGYKRSIPDICNDISIQITKNCIVIAHSYGCFYAQQLAYINDNI